MRLLALQTDPSPRCRRHDYEGTSSSLEMAALFAWPYTWPRSSVRFSPPNPTVSIDCKRHGPDIVLADVAALATVAGSSLASNAAASPLTKSGGSSVGLRTLLVRRNENSRLCLAFDSSSSLAFLFASCHWTELPERSRVSISDFVRRAMGHFYQETQC
jgi:hypothetical protein